jgi:ribosomal protein S12 methylthiotransferase
MSIKVGITSLGCAKNLVDSEVILGYLARDGLQVCEDLNDARVIIVNTCSFIREAEDEARETIGEIVGLKGRGGLERVMVAGCLPARRGPVLEKQLQGVDRFLSPCEIPYIAGIVRSLIDGGSGVAPQQPEGGRWFLYDHRSPRRRLSPPHYAYVKISEGCSNRCSYCLIPSIKGPLRSREIDSVIREAEALASEGVKEINLISQDTTAYGTDRYGESQLLEVLRRLVSIKGCPWIRLLYGNPSRYTDELLTFIAGEPAVCKYIDFPLQHIADRILESMNRRMTKADVVRGLSAVRRIIPGATVRTTLMVGYPGETEDDFRELLDFAREARFEHLGAFMYSREKGTAAAKLPGQIPHKEKRERFHRLMSLQQEIVREENEKMLGRVVDVLVDEELAEGSFPLRGRTEGDAPEVDGTVYISGNTARAGDFVRVRLTGVRDYDLVGEIINS